MAYARPLGHTFNQLNLNMYRLPDGQRGALRTTTLALARGDDVVDERAARDCSNAHYYNPFRGIKRLYADLRRHRQRRREPSDGDGDGARLRKYYSVPAGAGVGAGAGGSARPGSPPPGPALSGGQRKSALFGRYISDGEASDSSLSSESPQPRAPRDRRVRFSRGDPTVSNTYSPEEYDRRIVDPWEVLTKDQREQIRGEMNDYTTREMVLNDVYNTNASEYCTLCWRPRCHCRALSKDVWRRARSSSMVHAGA
ncbi:hypothetical protein H4R18_002551 [Coemansia javaensis]|uniref:Uncharacterized protein n=1 Tax=Coemansia javaensis TaxID=2761396 RepID=A0A9W8HCQ8_9FUNG|nr:hypothetical protein H4R18_002551 [Coemansia javaensis]